LWRAPPDAALFDAAANGQLSTPEQIGAQARRMMSNVRFQFGAARFFEELLGLTELESHADPDALPLSVIQAMQLETRAFITTVFEQHEAHLPVFFSSAFSFLNDELAEHYGLPLPGGTAHIRVSLPPERFSSLLTHGAFTASHPSPSQRGAALRGPLLCDDVPPHPSGLVTGTPQAGQTWREYLETELNNPACSACHALIDPLGFAFEGFDSYGRPLDNPRTDGSVALAGGIVDFSGISELATTLGSLDQTANCVGLRWLESAWRRPMGTGADAVAVDCLFWAFQGSGFDMRELLVALTELPSFRLLGNSVGPLPPPPAGQSNLVDHVLSESQRLMERYQEVSRVTLEQYLAALRG
jgi:hypothetical protein